jgi:hypothetical protein
MRKTKAGFWRCKMGNTVVMLGTYLLVVIALVNPSLSLASEAERENAIQYIGKLGGHLERGKQPNVQQVLGVNLSGTKMTDEDLQKIIAIQEIQTLILTHTKVSDKGLRHLRTLSNLRKLKINITPVTDSGVRELACLNTTARV